jgi:hypothetical protein
MDLSISMQSLKNVFRFPFQDRDWAVKLLIGSALAFASFIVPIIPGLPLMGYFARLIRAGARNDDPTRLPEWDEWGELFVDGLRMFGVMLLGLLPGLLVMTFGFVMYFGSVFSLIASDGRMGRGDPGPGFFLAMMTMFITIGLSTLLLMAAGLYLPPALAHVAVKRRFSAFFEVGAWWAVLRANLLGYLVILLIFGSLYFLVTIVTQVLYLTLIFCVLIPFVLLPLSMYMAVVLYRLIGQAYGEVRPPERMPEEPVDPELSASLPA